jgi:hypothetical protein
VQAARILTLVVLASVTLASMILVEVPVGTLQYTSQEQPLPKIAQAPGFTLTSQHGAQISLADLRGSRKPHERAIMRRSTLVGLVSRVPARVQVKLLAAFLAIEVLLIVMGAVGLQVLSGVNQRTDELIRLQRKIEAYRQVQHDTTSQLYSVSSVLLSSDDLTLSSTLRQLNQFGYRRRDGSCPGASSRNARYRHPRFGYDSACTAVSRRSNGAGGREGVGCGGDDAGAAWTATAAARRWRTDGAHAGKSDGYPVQGAAPAHSRGTPCRSR